MWYYNATFEQLARVRDKYDMTNDDETIKWLAQSIQTWRSTCDLTLMLRQKRPVSVGAGQWTHIDEAQARCAFRHFMNLLNRAVFGNAARRYGKRLRVIPVLEKGLNSPWHYHAAIEPPAHLTVDQFEMLIHDCWNRVGWGYPDVLVRPGADSGWIRYMLKRRQKAEFEQRHDCIDLNSFYNPDFAPNTLVASAV